MNASAPQIVNGSATGTLNNLYSALEDEAELSELGNITAEKYASSWKNDEVASKNMAET